MVRVEQVDAGSGFLASLGMTRISIKVTGDGDGG
jgi:hypothetical protein